MSASCSRRGSSSSARRASGRGRDVSGYKADDFDLRVADLHYRDVCEWAVGRNAAAGWDAGEDRAERVTRVWTDPLPQAEVERVAPNEDDELKSRVTFGMEALAERAATGGAALAEALSELPVLYGQWIEAERGEARRPARAPARDRGAPHRRDGDRAPAHRSRASSSCPATTSPAAPSAT